MTRRPTVLLFDIDGTLITAGGAGRRAIVRGVAAHGIAPSVFDGVRFNGMTDRGIVRAGLERAGREVLPSLVDAILATYLVALEDEVARSPGYRVHRGVEALLDALGGEPGIAIGLGTGNVRSGARVKLDRAGLFERFAFGGFGCDHEERPALLEVGARRGAELLETARARCRVVIIGDSTRDVEAARAIGAECLGVGTSDAPPPALRAAGATWAVPGLDEAGVLEALRG